MADDFPVEALAGTHSYLPSPNTRVAVFGDAGDWRTDTEPERAAPA
jgi:hypothetical protein